MMYIQVEFKVLLEGNQVGAIQVYAVRPKGLGLATIGMAINGSIAGQIAKGVANSFAEMKGGIGAGSGDMIFPDFYE
jgi:hypothetical protein